MKWLGWGVFFLFVWAGLGLLGSQAWAHRLEEEVEVLDPHYWEETLTGDWGGWRSRAHQAGWNVEVEYFGDFNGNVTGGNERQADFTKYLEAELLIDAEQWLGWKDTRFFFLGYGLWSTDPSVRINTRQTVSNLEATDTVKLFEAWWEKRWWDRRFSVKAGLYSLDTEFEFKPTANVFINGVFGTGVDLSELSRPAIYPLSALGVRLKVQDQGIYFQAAVVDGIPGDPDNQHGTQVVLDRDDGFLVAMETGYRLDGPDHPRIKLGVGSWVFTRRIPDFSNSTNTRRGRNSVYGFIDLRLYSEPQSKDQGLDGFFRVGVADTQTSVFKRNITGGLVYTGLLPGRDNDQLGAAVSTGWVGASFQAANQSSSTLLEEEEIVVELTYIIEPRPWLTLQPNVQYFIHPGLNPNLSDILYLGLRIEVEF